MDLTKIVATILITFICLLAFCIILIKIINKNLLLRHHIDIAVDGYSKKEGFDMVTGLNVSTENDPALKVTDKCENKSLNEMNKRNIGDNKPWEIACHTKTQTEEDVANFYKTTKVTQTYTADTPKQGIMGANYMMYNSNPNPYHLDFTLYDKNEPANTPVGVNYVTN